MEIIVLGCGASSGVPHIVHGFGNSDPNNPKNIRTRSSVFVKVDDFNILIDASPDLRQQFIRENLREVDAVFLTHEHSDHTEGLPDLRPLLVNQKGVFPLYGSESTIEEVKNRFDYLFDSYIYADVYKPVLTLQEVQPSFSLCKGNSELNVKTFPLWHGFSWCTGYRIKNFAYVTDIYELPAESEAYLQNLECLIIDGLSEKGKPGHASIKNIFSIIELVKPKMTYITHMDFTMDYETLCKNWPLNVRPAYDGLRIRC